tara:strand:- start:800 stop:2815 length:2016 start_codon:yes stop_codon:yes gene_type:complete
MVSCVEDDFNLSNIDTSQIQPEYKLPFASGELKLIDIINNIEPSVDVDDSTKILKVLFEDQNSFSLKSEKIISLDKLEYSGSKKILTKKIKIDSLDKLDRKITLSDLSDNMPSLNFVKLIPDNSSLIFPSIQSTQNGGEYSFSSFDNFKSVLVDSGFVNLKIKNNLPFPIDIDLIISDENEDILNIKAKGIIPNQVYNISEDIKDKVIYNDLKVEITGFNTVGSQGLPIDLSPSKDNIEISFEIDELIIREGEINISKIDDFFDGIFDIDLNFYDSVELKNIIFNQGRLNFGISSFLGYDVDIDYLIPAIRNNDTISDIIELNSNGSYNIDYDIKDYDFDLYNEIKEKYNNLRVTSKLKIKSETGYIFYKSNEEIDVMFTFSNLIFDEINGYFGNKKYLIEKEEIKLEKELLDFYDKIEGEFLFTNPSLGLTVNNSFGIPLFINLDIQALYNNNSESLIINDKVAEAKSKDGSFEETKIFIDKENSNILNFINLPPKDNLLIEGDIILNPDEKTYDNFILKNSEIEANIFLELPFQISATNLMISDTFQIEDINFDTDLSDARLLFNYESDIPLTFDIELIYLDKTLLEIDRNVGEINIKGSETNANGYSSGFISNTFEVNLSENLLERIKDLENIIMNIELNTDKNRSVNITSEIKFKFQSTIEFKLDGI